VVDIEPLGFMVAVVVTDTVLTLVVVTVLVAVVGCELSKNLVDVVAIP
jgi:hypothetical protein